jgi:subtilisin family serine protease
MKKLLYLLAILILAACGSEKAANISSDTSKVTSSKTKITAQSIISQMEKGNYKEGELLVKFKSGVVKASSLKVHQAVGASVAKRFHIVPNLEHVKLPEGLSVKDAVIQYMSDPNVEYAEPNYIRCASSLPPYYDRPDTYFNDQWALNNTGTYASGTAGADIQALDAWGVSTGSPGITIAVLDSGIDYNHQDLVGNIWQNPVEVIGDKNGDGCPGICGVDDDGDGKVDEDSLGRQPGEAGYTNDLKDDDDDDENGYVDDCKGWNFVDGNNDPMDDFYHGTHVAGIIGAKGNNGVGVAGVMWDVKLMPVKIYNADTTLTGSCTSVFAADEVAGIEYAVNNGAKIINASFHGEGYCNAEHDAIDAANTAEILFIAAAGNGTNNDGIAKNNDLAPQYPASYDLPNIISVAATDQNDRRASFSNYGPNTVDVAAPGVYILSTIPHNLYSDESDKEFLMGTSMATPHVSGLAGLLYSYYDGNHNAPLFNYSQVRDTILTCVDKEEDGYPGLQTLKGWIKTDGRINAYKAVASLAMPTNLTAATPTSTTRISLTWNDNARCEKGYKVERKISGGTWTEILPSLPPDSVSFTDTGLTPNTTYTYRVKAYNDIADSFYSTPDISATTLPTEPPANTGGGGGCSIGARQNTPTAIADLAVMLIPLIIIAIMRRRR